MKTKTNHRIETYIYLVLWTLLFITPIVSLYIHTHDYSEHLEWSEVLRVWRQYAIFLAIFLVHNFLLAPLFVYKKRKTLYLSIVTLLVGLFCIVQCSGINAPEKPGIHEEPRFDDVRPPMPHEEFHGHDDFHRPPLIVGEHDVVSIIILLLMLAANLGIKFYVKQRDDEKTLADLEKQNLEQQLDYLKYQINPHFLMNTLNNIHALVDIDPEMAKESIVELSKIMRFVLYEGNKKTVPLERELQFLQDYITLMRLRVSDKVPITVDIDEQTSGYEIPPLVLITFVENAFKHGISYNQPSFIDVKATVSGRRFVFTCSNSKIPVNDNKPGGIGLQNIQKRLELIYGKSYTLDISEDASTYHIKLEIPLS